MPCSICGAAPVLVNNAVGGRSSRGKSVTGIMQVERFSGENSIPINRE